MAHTKDAVRIGEFIASQRKAQKLSQEALAKVAELSRGYLALIEQGRNTPSRKTVKTLALALGVDVDDLLKMAGHEPEGRDSPVVPAVVKTGNNEDQVKLPRFSYEELHTDVAKINNRDADDSEQEAGVAETLKWAYECIKRDPNFNFNERMGGQELPPGIWLGFIDMYQGLTGRMLLKPEEIGELRNTENNGQ